MVETPRRRFLRFLLASPVAAELTAICEAFGQEKDDVITAPDQALDVLEFEAAARKRLPPAHFGFLATGVDGDATRHGSDPTLVQGVLTGQTEHGFFATR